MSSHFFTCRGLLQEGVIYVVPTLVVEALICTRLSGCDDCELPSRRAAFVDVHNARSRAQLVRLRRHLSIFFCL